jgi:hypothetical protein
MITEHPADIVLLDYVEGVLRGDESESVRRHIATCRACRRTLAEISSAISELERLPTAELPRAELGNRSSRWRLVRLGVRFVPVALAALALAFAFLFTRPGSPSPKTSTVTDTTPAGSLWYDMSVGLTPDHKMQRLRNALAGFGRPVVAKDPSIERFIAIVPAYYCAQAHDALLALPHAPFGSREASDVVLACRQTTDGAFASSTP